MPDLCLTDLPNLTQLHIDKSVSLRVEYCPALLKKTAGQADHVVLKSCPGLTQLPNFKKTTRLDIDDCSGISVYSMIEWDAEYIRIADPADSLYIYDCPRLKHLVLPNKINQITISGCPIKKIVVSGRYITVHNMQQLEKLTVKHAIRLDVGNCSLTGVSLTNQMRVLNVVECNQLIDLRPPTELAQLSIRDCPRVQLGPIGLRLTELSIVGANVNIEYIPRRVKRLTLLRGARARVVHDLVAYTADNLPAVFGSITNLSISGNMRYIRPLTARNISLSCKNLKKLTVRAENVSLLSCYNIREVIGLRGVVRFTAMNCYTLAVLDDTRDIKIIRLKKTQINKLDLQSATYLSVDECPKLDIPAGEYTREMLTAMLTDSNGTCVVCRERSALYAMVPCGHLCGCYVCLARLDRCPICRLGAKSVMRIYT
jgi:hypothetical protein